VENIALYIGYVPYLNTVSIVATWLVLALEALFHDA